MDKRIWCVVVLMIGSVSLLGCSKKTDTSTPDAGGGSGTGAAGKSTAGGGGSAGRGTGGMTGAIAMNVPCGDTKCAGSAPNPQMMMIPGFTPAKVCCVSEATSTCGTMSNTTMMCEPPPEIAPKCPKLFMNSFPGCCAGNNSCGADLSITGMGCLDLVKARMMFGPAAMNFFPAPAHCDDGSPIPPPDAGMMMTGNDAGE